MQSNMSMDYGCIHRCQWMYLIYINRFFVGISSPTRGSTVAEPLRLPGTFETSKSAAQTSFGAGSTGIGQF